MLVIDKSITSIDPQSQCLRLVPEAAEGDRHALCVTVRLTERGPKCLVRAASPTCGVLTCVTNGDGAWKEKYAKLTP
jgi:hypothetical protein